MITKSSGKWIEFIASPRWPGRVTDIWVVKPRESNSDRIGDVRWYGRWRKYCFFPDANTVYEQDCLRDIAEFCEQRTKEHKGHAGNVGK